MNRVGLALECLADARRALDFERSRAASPDLALGSWAGGQRRRLERLRRMGSARHAGLQRVEAACAQAGLLYPTEDAGQVAPWHLPERFWQLPASLLPPHPVIDTQALDTWLPPVTPPRTAAQALAALAEQQAWPGLWRHLPLLGDHAPKGSPTARIAVCLHLFYPELWAEVREQLLCIPEPYDLYISVPGFAASGAWELVVRDEPRVRFMPVVNRGRDVAPWLAWLRSGVLQGYDAVCKLHSKRSPHMQGGDAWRDQLLHALLGGRGNVHAILAQLRRDPALLMLGPATSHQKLVRANGWARNRVLTGRLARQLGLAAISEQTSFFAGTMFWFKPAAFDLLRLSRLQTRDFPVEMGQTDGTLAHALERLLVPMAMASGGSICAWPGSATTLTAP